QKMKKRLVVPNHMRGRARAIQPSLKSGEGIKIERSITINRTPEELYHFWRRLENLPRFMAHIQSVAQIGDGISHWMVKPTHNQTLEWDARLIEDKPGHMISWQSLPGADMDNAGSVWFTPTADGGATVVKVAMKYAPPGGRLATMVAKLSGIAEKELDED